MTCLRSALLSYGVPVPSPRVTAGVCRHFRACSPPGLHLSPAVGGGSSSQVGIALKPFLPQLQTTFTKALQDSNRGVRLKAADALGKLISIHVKVDPLFTELLNGIRVMEDPGVR